MWGKSLARRKLPPPLFGFIAVAKLQWYVIGKVVCWSRITCTAGDHFPHFFLSLFCSQGCLLHRTKMRPQAQQHGVCRQDHQHKETVRARYNEITSHRMCSFDWLRDWVSIHFSCLVIDWLTMDGVDWLIDWLIVNWLDWLIDFRSFDWLFDLTFVFFSSSLGRGSFLCNVS